MIPEILDFIRKNPPSPELIKAAKEHLEATKNLVALIEKNPKAFGRFIDKMFNPNPIKFNSLGY